MIFISCKNEPKTKTETETEIATKTEIEMDTENGFDKSVYEMWNNFIESNPEFKNEELPNIDFFDNSEDDYHRYADLIVTGKKRQVLVYIFGIKMQMLICQKKEQNLL